jgi:hypothetical protein
MGGMMRPISIGSLVFFRICFGMIMGWEAWRYIASGWVDANFSDYGLHFPYDWFMWVKPLPGNGMTIAFLFMGGMGICMAFGLLYRFCAIAFTLALTYIFLIDKANYLNHIYLVCILGAFMAITPCHRAFSLDALLRPQIRSNTISSWYLWILRIQIGLVYLFAGIAKLKWDWLVVGHPLAPWLAEHADTPVIGKLFLIQPVVLIIAWSGMILDLAVFPALLFRRTRPFAVAFLIVFHLSNAFLFDIGIFPWMMLAATTLYFEPDWLRRWPWFWQHIEVASHNQKTKPLPSWAKYSVLGLICAHFAFQLFLPLRHYFIPGDVNWTKEGSRFAWRMKLNRRSGSLRIFIQTDRVPERTELNLESFLNRRQISKLRVWPDIVHDLALMIEKDLEAQGHKEVKVFVDCRLSLNNREDQLIFDPNTDLTEYPRAGWMEHQPFILPIKNGSLDSLGIK